MNTTNEDTRDEHRPVELSISPNPWNDAHETVETSHPTTATTSTTMVPSLPSELDIEASTKAFDAMLPPKPPNKPTDISLLNEFDPLADKTEVEAQQAWALAEGRPPPPPPRTPVPEPVQEVARQKPNRPESLLFKSRRRPSTALEPPTSAAATVTSFATLANLARTIGRSRPATPSQPSPKAPHKPVATDTTAPPHTPAKDDGPQGPTTNGTVEPPAKPEPPAFDFQKFLDQMKTRSAEPVAKYLRSFLNNFSKRNFTVNDQIKLIHDFLSFIAEKMRECDIWKHASHDEFDNAIEGMEKLVMNRLYDFTFTPQIDSSSHPITTDDLERDHILRQRMKLFGWVKETHLDVPTGEGSQGFIDFACQELLKINHYKAPRDKLICILNACKVIFGLIRHLNHDEGADSFIPILIFVVLRSNPEHLMSNIEYINRFRSPSKLQSEAGYYLSSLMGSVSFIETMDHTSLSNITQEEFEQNVETAIQALPPSPAPLGPTQFSKHTSPQSPSVPTITGPHSGEESARPLQLPSTTTVAEDAKRFLQRTGDIATETISKPLSAIGRIFNDALDGLDERERDREQMLTQEREQRRADGVGSSFLPSSWFSDGPTRSATPSESRASEFDHLRAEDQQRSRSAILPRTPAGGGAALTPGGIQQTPYRPRVARRPSGGLTPGRGTPDPTFAGQQQEGQPINIPSQANQQNRSSPFQIPPFGSFFTPSPSQRAVNLPPAARYDSAGPISSSLPSSLSAERGQRYLPPQNQQSQAIHQPQPLYARLPHLNDDGRNPSPLDLTALSNEIDRAHYVVQEASRGTLLQIFPTCEPEIIDMVLEATENDLGLSIDRLLEMTSA